MKTYKIVLLTPQGIKTETYTDTQPLNEFEAQMVDKYGTFILQSSNKINQQ
jgi:hypothetical protein